MSIDHLRGMAGILQFKMHIGDIIVAHDREAILKAFHWLKKIIPYMNNFLSQKHCLLSNDDHEWSWESSTYENW